MRGRLKELRKSLKLSQVKFGENLELSGGYIAELETGKKPIVDRIVKLTCLVYGVSENWLREGEGEMMSRPSSPPSRAERILAGFERLKPEFQEFVLKKIDELLVIQDDEPKGHNDDFNKNG